MSQPSARSIEPAGAQRAAPEAFDGRWKDLTRRANVLFEAGETGRAGPLYAVASREARAFFAPERWDELADPAALISMLSVSAGNEAENARRHGDLDALEAIFTEALGVFVAILENPAAPKALRASCARHLPMVLIDFRGKLVEAPASASSFASCFERARRAALAFDETPRS